MEYQKEFILFKDESENDVYSFLYFFVKVKVQNITKML